MTDKSGQDKSGHFFATQQTEYYHPTDDDSGHGGGFFGCGGFLAKWKKKGSSNSSQEQIETSEAAVASKKLRTRRSLYTDPSLHLNKHLEPTVPMRRPLARSSTYSDVKEHPKNDVERVVREETTFKFLDYAGVAKSKASREGSLHSDHGIKLPPIPGPSSVVKASDGAQREIADNRSDSEASRASKAATNEEENGCERRIAGGAAGGAEQDRMQLMSAARAAVLSTRRDLALIPEGDPLRGLFEEQSRLAVAKLVRLTEEENQFESVSMSKRERERERVSTCDLPPFLQEAS